VSYQLVIFDMDGTLTEELLDYPTIRKEIGLPPTGGILELLAHVSIEQRQRAEAVIVRHEMAAAEKCSLHDGAAQVLRELGDHRIHTALLTRNSARCSQRILARHYLVLDHVATREDMPHKPHPDSILNITRRFSVLPRQTLMVGDYLYDVEAARNAGADSALLCTRYGEVLPAFAALATYRIQSLHEVPALVGVRQGVAP
jgi:HAD superfamily hydrolase (TIGR01509 family)